MACLIEHYGGAFPVWLSPVQAIIIPIADRHNDYAHQIGNELQRKGIRSKVDDRVERMNLKIREAQLGKVPYMLVVGDKEVASAGVALRLKNGEDAGQKSILEVETMIGADIEAYR